MVKIRQLVVLMALTALPAHARQSDWELPADPLAPVITLNYVGGVTDLPRQNVLPQLSIRADGQVMVNDPFNKARNVEGTIPPAALHDLMRFVIYEQGFFQFNTLDTQAEILAQSVRCGKSIGIVTPDTIVIHVKTADNEQEARFNALSTLAAAYPSVKSLAQLRAIETRLRYLMEEIRAGGSDVVANGVDQVNSYMKRQSSTMKLEVGDLRRAITYTDGRKMLEFTRDCGDGTSISVSVEFSAKMVPTVSSQFSLNPPLQPVISCP